MRRGGGPKLPLERENLDGLRTTDVVSPQKPVASLPIISSFYAKCKQAAKFRLDERSQRCLAGVAPKLTQFECFDGNIGIERA
jgi:hypothetical protein